MENTRINFDDIYDQIQKDLIFGEFKRLQGQYYLDHAGATLYSDQQISRICEKLQTNLYGNPHAKNLASKTTEDAIDLVRYRILKHFHAKDYTVVFTSGATAGLKFIAETFRYRGRNSKIEGSLVYLEDNHTSVLGMRDLAKNCQMLKVKKAQKLLGEPVENLGAHDDCNSLFVYPGQSNFSGTKYPLKWIKNVENLNLITRNKSENWYVLLDAASLASTSPLYLDEHQPDFVVVSFYKIFGYPTGLGALLIKNSSVNVLDKQYYGGGTVQMIVGSEKVKVPRLVPQDRFEDGTVSYLSILSLNEGFDTIDRLGLNFTTISEHTFALAQYVAQTLQTLHHNNSRPVAIVYNDTNFTNAALQGGIVNFNLLRPNGEYIGYSEVTHFADLYGIHLRTGCSCNPGACQRFLQLTPDDIIKHFRAGHVCGDQYDLVNGQPTGSVRISFGYMSTKSDADRLLEMVEECFVVKPLKRLVYPGISPVYSGIEKISPKLDDDSTKICEGILRDILLYPIKSCAGFRVKEWSLTNSGLKYDRQWMIIDSMGVCLTQKHNKKMCMIRPSINLRKNTMELHFRDEKSIELAIEETNQEYLMQSKICNDKVQGWDCGDKIAQWLDRVLDSNGLRLIRQCEDFDGRISKTGQQMQLSLANKAQYLLVNSASVRWLIDRTTDGFHEEFRTTIDRFRPNFVVEFPVEFVENDLDTIAFDEMVFKHGGKCTRCQMICINQSNGKFSKEPLHTLSREFKGKISFGIYLNNDGILYGNDVFIGMDVKGYKIGQKVHSDDL